MSPEGADELAQGAEPAVPPAAASRKTALRQWGLALLLLAGLSLAVLSLSDQAREVRAGAQDLSVAPVAAAALCVFLSLTFNLLSWRSMLSALGSHVPMGGAARIFFIGQLGKYVPGSVWPIVAQMELGAAYGLSRAAVGTAALLTMAVASVVALVLGLLAVPALLSADASPYLLLFLVLPLAVIVLAPPVLNPLLDRALRLVRRSPLPTRLSAPGVLRVAGFAGAAQLLLGLQAWLLAGDLGVEGLKELPLFVGAFCLASVASLLALAVPAGAGVREAVLVVALSPALPAGQALVVALASRALMTAGDLGVAGAAARYGRKRDGQEVSGRGATGGDTGRPT